MDVVIGRHGGPHLSLVDTRGLQRVDPAAFSVMKDYALSRRDTFGKLIQKQALICSTGLPGAVVAGFFAVLRPAYNFGICHELDEALDWLGVSDPRVHELLRDSACWAEDDPVLQRLRDLLMTSERRGTVAAVARALGVSVRSLQRKLSHFGTSFKREQQRSQVRRAQELMLMGRLTLSSVAFAVGCASLQHFSTVFYKVTGKTPSRWRREQDTSA
jgi:AraC-like DNA-binding protein